MKKEKKPIFKRWWFWAVIALLVIGVLAPNGTQTDQGQQETKVVEVPSTPSPSPSALVIEAEESPEPSITREIPAEPTPQMVWVPTNGGTKYHRKSDCSGMEDPIQMTKEEAIEQGFEPCGRCA